MSPFAQETAKVVIEEKIPVITTGAGNPGKYMKNWIEAGIKVIPVVPSVALARMVERQGAFAVIAEGGESGGHVGDLTTMALVPQVADAVSIPVIAAGGIADGRQLAAAFMLGAVGVQVGTRFLVAKECTVSQEYKNKILKAKDIDTVVTGKRLGHPVRSLKNAFTRAYAKAEYSSDVSDEELENMAVGLLRKAAKEGDVVNGSVLAGQVASMVKEEQTAREIIVDIFSKAEKVLFLRDRERSIQVWENPCVKLQRRLNRFLIWRTVSAQALQISALQRIRMNFAERLTLSRACSQQTLRRQEPLRKKE